MKVAEQVAAVEASRQQQHKQAQVATHKRASTSRNDIIIFIGVLAVAILSVVAMFLKG